jgi:Right handed beta helix region
MKYIRLIAAGAVVAGLLPGRAQAQISRVFVSVSGNDLNDCLQPTSACRTLDGGIGKVDADGEVIVIDTGSFAGANITKGVKINVPSGVIAFSALSLVVNAPGETVVLHGLTLKAFTPGSGNGIDIQAAGRVAIENCVVDGWGDGIRVQTAAGAVRVDVKDTTLRNNASEGLAINGPGAVVTVDHSLFERNYIGFRLSSNGRGRITRSLFVDHSGWGAGVNGTGRLDASRSTFAGSVSGGFFVYGGGTGRVSGSLITGNGVGLENNNGVLESFLDNILRGNAENSTGTITSVSRQ